MFSQNVKPFTTRARSSAWPYGIRSAPTVSLPDLEVAPLARYFTLAVLGFHDTSFGEHVEVGLHAVAVDQHRAAIRADVLDHNKGRATKGPR